MHAPSTVYLWHDTEIGQDTVIEPNVIFGPEVKIAEAVTIKGFSHLEGSAVKKGAILGPFARLSSRYDDWRRREDRQFC